MNKKHNVHARTIHLLPYTIIYLFTSGMIFIHKYRRLAKGTQYQSQGISMRKD